MSHSELTIDGALQRAISCHQAGDQQTAEKLYRAILEVMPTHPDANHNLGVLALSLNHGQQALPYLVAALNANSDHPQFWVSYLLALLDCQMYAEVQKVLPVAQAKGVSASTIEQLNARFRQEYCSPEVALALREQGHYHDAATRLHAWLSTQAQDVTACALLAHVLSLAGDDTGAAQALEKAAAISPTHPAVFKNRARLLLKQGAADAALKTIKAALVQAPDDLESQLVKASALTACGKAGAAKVLVGRILEKCPAYAEALLIHAHLKLQFGDERGALADAEQAAGIKPHLPQAWQLCAEVYKRLGRNAEAIRSLERQLALEPENVEALSSLGDLLRMEKSFEVAEQLFVKAIELNPKGISALVNYGALLQDRQRNKEAVNVYNHVLALNPDTAEVLVNLGWLMLEEKKNAIAVKLMRRAFELRPDHPLVASNFLTALIADQQLDAASHLVQSVGAKFQRDPKFIATCGVLALKKKDWVGARRYLKQSLALAPGDPRCLMDIIPYLCADNQFDEALRLTRELLAYIASATPAPLQQVACPMVALMPIGRAGSLFFHSLVDGHPDMATLPGVYFKGWFGWEVWKRFAPKADDPQWRERLVQLITEDFEPLFDGRSKKNVVGKPFVNAQWLAEASGFMEMGPEKNLPFTVDRNAFVTAMLQLLSPMNSVDQKTCFKLIHRAFEIGVRNSPGDSTKETGAIFYHIHNPRDYELANFIHHYPQAKLLYIVRNPVQSMESWMLNELGLVELMLQKVPVQPPPAVVEKEIRLSCWSKAVRNAVQMFEQIRSPYNVLDGLEARGLRLEDVKRQPKQTMPQVAAWMGVADHPALYEASFCGMQYWGPTSKLTGQITGFDTKAVDRPTGQLLGPRDVKIFETLFWPFSRLYGYTELAENAFLKNLDEIRPWLDEPLEFEKYLHAELPDYSEPLSELPVYVELHEVLLSIWSLLKRDGTFHGMPTPLELNA